MRVIGKMLDILLGEGFMRGGRENLLAVSSALGCLCGRLGCGFGDRGLDGGL
jgi:hypothetical protein